MNKLLEMFVEENERAKEDYDHEEVWAKSIAKGHAEKRLEEFKNEMQRQGLSLNHNQVVFK